MRIFQSLAKPTQYLATGYYASVMATGIVSIALFLEGFASLSDAFLVITTVLYVVLTVAYTVRLFLYPREVWRDLTDAGRVFGYFTFIAGTDVLGTRFAMDARYGVALALGIIALVSWLGLTYFILMFLLFYNKEPIREVMNGSWLIATVSCESLAVLGSELADYLPQHHTTWLLFVSYAFWALGVIIYLIFIAMIMYRFFFIPMSPKEMSPPYWINMGAVAITTLAGSRLVLYPHATDFLVFIRPFVEGYTIMLWVWGTWWIPLLVLMGVWKYVVFREHFSYEPGLWSIVFPLGMYTVACETLGSINGLAIIHSLVIFGLWIAVAAWAVVAASYFYGMCARSTLKVRIDTARDCEGKAMFLSNQVQVPTLEATNHETGHDNPGNRNI